MRSAPGFAIALLLTAILGAGCISGGNIALPAIPAGLGTNDGSYQYGGTAVAISVKSDDISSHSPLARILFLKALTISTQYAEYNESIAYFDKSLTIDQNFTVAWVGRGVALHNMHRYDEAVQSYDRALALNMNDANVWTLKGITLNDMGREADSGECYKKAAEITLAAKRK